jgi:hypothetical protein
MTNTFAEAISPEARAQLEAMATPDVPLSPEGQSEVDGLPHGLYDHPIFAGPETPSSNPEENRPNRAKLALEKVQAVVTSYDGRQDTPEAAIKILEDRFAEGLPPTDSVEDAARSLQDVIIKLPSEVSKAHPDSEPDTSLRTTMAVQHTIDGVKVFLVGVGDAKSGANVSKLEEGNGFVPLVLSTPGVESPKEVVAQEQEADSEISKSHKFGVAGVVAGIQKAVQKSKEKAGQGKAIASMARSRAVQFADSWKERRQQPQPNKQLRKLGAVVLVAASVGAVGAVAGARKAADWLHSAGSRTKAEVYMAPTHLAQSIGAWNERRQEQATDERNRKIGIAVLAATGIVTAVGLYVATKNGAELLGHLNFGNKGHGAANDALNQLPTPSPSVSTSGGHETFTDHSSLNDFLSPSKGDGLKEHAAEQVTAQVTSVELPKNGTIWNEAHNMLQEAGLDHGNANVDAVTNALQDQLGVNDFQATQLPVGFRIPWLSEAQLHEILSHYDNTIKKS